MKQKCFLITIVLFITILAGCTSATEKPQKIRDLEFTVVCEDKLPKELQEAIAARKENRFELAYSDGGYTYLCRGYGKQDTGGYSIKVIALYQTKEGVVLDTEFIGPNKSEEVPQSPSYPYIVVKTEELGLKKSTEKGAQQNDSDQKHETR